MSNDGKREMMAPAVKRWKRLQLFTAGMIIFGSTCIVVAVALLVWKVA